MRTQWLVNALVVLIALYLVFPHGQRAVLAAFNAPPQSWTTTYESDPTATDPVSQGDDHLRALKTETRRRGVVEHDWSTVAAFGTDTGRHYPGAARVFFQSAAPTVDGSISAACLFRPDTAGNQGCDEGRVWIDSDDNSINVCDDTDSDGDCDAWEAVIAAVPTNAMILWDSSNTCPTGYTEATEFRNLTIRGADRASATVNVPDNAGVSCSGSGAPAGCGAPGGTDNYDDIPTTDELVSHNHAFNATNQTLAGGAANLSTTNTGTTTITANTGNSEPHLHPLRTVIFCRKS